ncbi:hypothetical protein LCGC14_0915710 [marine sediment metagenome]|uniref:Uncharacterized protein n=1 Tax=marine sediment metagenome TaxID=412755 RepID=A0A0F9NX26_9ZZZZ
MPRGQPDFGIYTETPVASGISDPGEAAARLGSINVYDRRGWTVWMDDFEAPSFKWISFVSPPGALPVLVTTASWRGAQSVYLNAVAGAGGISGMLKIFPLLRLGRLGIEFWTRGVTVSPGYLGLVFDIFDGTNQSRAEVRADFLADTVSIVTPAGTIVIDTGAFPLLALMPFVPIKIVVDMDDDTYTRLMIGHQEYDISAHALVPVGATTNRLIRAQFSLNGAAGGDSYAWLENFILTQNEP